MKKYRTSVLGITTAAVLVASIAVTASATPEQEYEKAYYLEVGKSQTNEARTAYEAIIAKYENDASAADIVNLCRERLQSSKGPAANAWLVPDSALTLRVDSIAAIDRYMTGLGIESYRVQREKLIAELAAAQTNCVDENSADILRFLGHSTLTLNLKPLGDKLGLVCDEDAELEDVCALLLAVTSESPLVTPPDELVKHDSKETITSVDGRKYILYAETNDATVVACPQTSPRTIIFSNGFDLRSILQDGDTRPTRNSDMPELQKRLNLGPGSVTLLVDGTAVPNGEGNQADAVFGMVGQKKPDAMAMGIQVSSGAVFRAVLSFPDEARAQSAAMIALMLKSAAVERADSSEPEGPEAKLFVDLVQNLHIEQDGRFLSANVAITREQVVQAVGILSTVIDKNASPNWYEIGCGLSDAFTLKLTGECKVLKK